MKQLTELNTISERVEKIKQEIQLLILNLPDNPNIKRLSPKAFTINSSQIFGNLKDNPSNRMDVFFHDFKAQYEYISGVIEKTRSENVVGLIQRIISEGTHKNGADYRSFNPSVIEHLKNLIEK